MKRENIFLIVMMLGLLCISGFAKDLQVKSVWKTAEFNLDGQNAEWADDVLKTEEKLSIDLAFKNDNEFLYILFMFKDPQFMSSIRETGLTVYFSTEGKRKKNTGVKFNRQQIPAEAFLKIVEGQKGELTEEQKNEVMSRKSYSIRSYKVIKKGKEVEIPKDVEQTKMAQFRVGAEARTAVYEIIVPLAKSEAQMTGIGTEPGADIKVGFEWGGLTPEKRARMMARMIERSAEAGAKADRGDPTRAGSGVNTSEEPSLSGMTPKKFIFWVDLQLAKEK